MGATFVGAVVGFAVGSLVGLAIDKDNWWKYGIASIQDNGIDKQIRPRHIGHNFFVLGTGLPAFTQITTANIKGYFSTDLLVHLY